MRYQFVSIFWLIITVSNAQEIKSDSFWEITERHSIVLDLSDNTDRLPLSDNIEMSGKKVSAIVQYSLDDNGYLQLERDVIYPQLRTFNKTNEPDWKKYRAYFRQTYTDDILPRLSVNKGTLIPGPIDSIEIASKLTFYHAPVKGIRIQRTLMPSMEERLFVEKWIVQNIADEVQDLTIGNSRYASSEMGYKGTYHLNVYSDASSKITLQPNEEYTFGTYFAAGIDNETVGGFEVRTVEKQRDVFLAEMKDNLILKTSNKVLNTLFYFSKIRAAESIFYSSTMGYIHSPGGGNYYLGIWANDQIEYSGPFFPYLGYETGIDAAFNAYDWFLKNVPKDDAHIPYAFEVEGNFPMDHLDRGDAAMIAYGTSQYLLRLGNEEMAQNLWPLVEWSLEYCHKNRNAAGAVISASDEMEGRISTGTANLATSSLYYGGLKFSMELAAELGLKSLSKTYKSRMLTMESVIEDYFGSSMEGLDTYKYFDNNQFLRHWICLPLVMGINKRSEGTREALLSKLWTENGVLVELNPTSENAGTFWDRGTLYALRGTFKAGAIDQSLDKLLAFSEKRLLGDHVPYVVEAYPENNMKHLSAESALYCRIFIEGLLGFEQTGFRSLSLTASLPIALDQLELNKIHLADTEINVSLLRKGNKIEVTCTSGGKILISKKVENGAKINISY